MFGSKSKHYCRYCGRLYCKACTKEVPIPELGYTDKTRICNACFNFKNGRPIEQSDNNPNDTPVVTYDDGDTKSLPTSTSPNKHQQARPSSSSPSSPTPTGSGKGSGGAPNTSEKTAKGNTSTSSPSGSNKDKGGKKTKDENASNKNTKKTTSLGFLDDEDIGEWGAGGKAKDEDEEDDN